MWINSDAICHAVATAEPVGRGELDVGAATLTDREELDRGVLLSGSVRRWNELRDCHHSPVNDTLETCKYH